MADPTPGPWSVPHFARDDHSCNCGYVLSEHQHGMGAIATVHVSEEGSDWREGDHEPPAVAKANARLIAAAPELLEADMEALDTVEKLIADLREEDADRHAQRIAALELVAGQLRAAIAKATGR